MTVASTLAFPSSRALAGWWRQLTPHKPEAVWVGHLSLHRVEALVELVHQRRPDSFTLLVLQALALERAASGDRAATPSPDELLARLDERFHLGRSLLRQVVRSVQAEGLVEGGCALTPLGEQALTQGEYPWTTRERRGFHFVEPRSRACASSRPVAQAREGEDSGEAALPHFLDLNSHSSVPRPVAEEWQFDLGALRACLERPTEWKERYGFPQEVRAILNAVSEPVPPWQQVIVDRPERLLAVMVPVTGAEGRKLLGFSVKQEGWLLQTGDPVFAIRDKWDELFPELSNPPAAPVWREVWRAWCQPRGVPMSETEACTVELQGARLLVRAPAKLIERLRADRSDAVKGEAWVLAGDGPIRAAALLELVPS
jgi:hypothetical protein